MKTRFLSLLRQKRGTHSPQGGQPQPQLAKSHFAGAPRSLAFSLQPSAFSARAFSLVEILVTMTLLTMIVLGLLLMFNQTQRAFRIGLGQTDVLEGGRGAMDMLVRQLEQLTPSQAPAFTNSSGTWLAMNLWFGTDPNFANPMVQYLPTPAGTPGFRTNIIDQFFLLTRLNQDWIPLYYRIQPAAPGSAVGSLYCYSPTNWPRYAPLTPAHAGHLLLAGNQSASTFYLPQPPGWSTNRVADGIVHFQLRAFDANGVPFVRYDDQYLGTIRYPYPLRPTLNNASSAGFYPLCDIRCWSNAVPAYLELEMGILESKTLQHYLAIDPSTPAAQNYLSNHVGEVHLFRQRIPIRNVDFSAYQ